MSRPPPSTTTRAATSDSPPSSATRNHEEVLHDDEEQNIQPQASEPNAFGIDIPPDRDTNDINNPPYHFDWAAIIVGFSLTSAVEIALQSLQPQIKLPSLMHLLSLAIIFAFASIFVSNFLSLNYPNVASALKLTAKLSVFAAFFFAITVPFSLSLKLISWSIFGLCLLAIAYAAFARGHIPHA